MILVLFTLLHHVFAGIEGYRGDTFDSYDNLEKIVDDDAPLEFRRIEMESDGNCLFRAIAHHVYGDVGKHLEVRRKIVDHLIEEKKTYPWELYGGLELERPFDEKKMQDEFKKLRFTLLKGEYPMLLDEYMQELQKKTKSELTSDEMNKLWNCILTDEEKEKMLLQFRWGFYFSDMAENTKWGNEHCISAAQNIWKLTIHIYNSSNDNEKNGEKWEEPYIFKDEEGVGREIFLEYTGNHYNLLERTTSFIY